MIQDYKVENGKIIAYDDNKGFVDYDYRDNIDEIFIQENIIEKINDDIILKKGYIAEKEKFFDLKYDKKTKLIASIGSTVFFAAIYILIFYSIPTLAITSIFLSSLTFNTGLFLMDLGPKNELKNKINADTLEIQELEKLLENEKTKLEELKRKASNDKSKEKQCDFKNKNNTRLKEIDNLKKLYRTCGYYAKKLVKYQQKNILRDKLDDSFTDEDFVIIENLVKEKCPQLVKKSFNK